MSAPVHDPDAPGAGQEPSPRRPPSGPRSRRWAWRVGGAVLVAALGVAGWWLARRSDQGQGVFEGARALSARQTEAVLHDPLGIDDPEGKALARIFSRLRALEEGETDRVAILQLGASHTAGQYFADRVRERLQQRFGSAGRGFVAAGEPEGDRPHTGVVRIREGEWTVSGAIHKEFGQRWGLSGIRAEAQPGARITFDLCTDCEDAPIPAKLQIFTLHRPGDGKLEVQLDGRTVATLPRRRRSGEWVDVHTLSALGGRQRVSLRA